VESPASNKYLSLKNKNGVAGTRFISELSTINGQKKRGKRGGFSVFFREMEKMKSEKLRFFR